MARIRTIKPEFFTSEQIVECSTSARLLFVGLWCFSDDAGRHPASCTRLKMEIFPGDKFTARQIEGMVTELINAGLLIEYESQGVAYWEVTGWARHQKVERPTVKHPGPFDDGSTITRRGVGEASPPEGSLMEGKGRDVGAHARAGSKKPTTIEVADYCRERKNRVDAQRFVDYYEANGWRVGKNPMKDWRAAVRTWERNSFADKQAETEPAAPSLPFKN